MQKNKHQNLTVLGSFAQASHPSPQETVLFTYYFYSVSFQFLLQSHLKYSSLGLIKFERIIFKWLRWPRFKAWTSGLLSLCFISSAVKWRITVDTITVVALKELLSYMLRLKCLE